jgi:FlaA1/EpsC-like NDP-sugar epimerase
MHGGEIFVPKLPSMSIMEIAAAVAPDCEVDVIGIRPGEKLHELLISEDEARQTVELDDMYVVTPPYPWWDPANFAGGRRLPDGFVYTSQANDFRLAAEDLPRLMA